MPADRDPADPAVRLRLLDLLGGFLRTQALHTVAVLGIADLVGDEPVSVQDLAAQVEADASALHRVLRVLSSDGIFSQVAPGLFVATALSDGLRTDAPLSVRQMAMFQGSDTYLAAGEMLRAVQTGEPTAETVFGTSIFEHLARDPERDAVFNQAMGGGAAARAAAAATYDRSGASVVAGRRRRQRVGPDRRAAGARAPPRCRVRPAPRRGPGAAGHRGGRTDGALRHRRG